MKNFELIFYQVSIVGNDYLETIYEGIDFYRAKREYDLVGISDFQNDYGGEVMLEKSQKTFRYVYDLDDLEVFPIEKYYAKTDLYEELDSTEPEIVFQKQISYINKQSDELLSRVQDHYFEIYGEYKYNNIPVTNDLPEDDDNFVEFGCIQLRLADHSENLQNIDRFGVCDYYISVVIAEKNATKDLFFSNKFDRRKNEIELHFDSDANFETIVSEIDQKIENGKQIVRMKYNQENQIELGRGGRISQAQENMPKFAKIGITDKYEIEAIIDIGLAGVKFTKEGVQDAIKNAYTELAENVSEYVVSEVSQAIVNVIINERNVQLEQGASLEVVEQYDELIESESAHLQYLNKFAEAQKSTLAEWVNYLNQSEYPYAFRYLILRSVLLDNYDFKNDQLVKRNKKTIRNFTAFDAGTLAQLFSKESDYLLKDFSILQLENIERIVKAKEIAKTSGNGIWLKFNGGSSTPEAERRANATELMQLVQDTYWCTKTAASGQINGGDFYVYVTESEGKKFPRIAIRMDENKVGEVRGNASAAQDLEPEMIPIAESFLEKNFQDESGKKWLESVRYNKRAYNLYLKVLEEGIFEGFVEEFIDLKKDEKRFTLDYSDRNGHIQRSENYLNENKDELRAVYGDRVAMDLNEFNPKTTEIIIGYAFFSNSQVQSLGNLQTIGGKADFRNSEVQDLGNLQTIGGNANFKNSKVKNLGNLQTIGGDADFEESQVRDLGNLQTIGSSAFFSNSQVQSLGNLQTIGRWADFRNSKVEDLGNLQTIGMDADFWKSKVQDLGNLQKIGGSANFIGSQVQDLGNLQTIGGGANFENSQVESLGNLQTIGRYAYFQNSQIQSLGNLQKIGGSADFQDSKVKDLGNLQTIGGRAFFGNRTDLKAEWEQKQKAVEMGRGGRITQAQENMPKFAKIGISDKYEIEAIIDIGLAGVKFTKEGVQEAIKNAYTELAENVGEYVVSEVSQAIVNVIINERSVKLVQGASLEVLEKYDGFIESESAHLQYLNKFAEAQKSTLAEWVNYLNQSEYPYAFRYFILRSVLLDNYDFKNDQLVKRNKKTIRNFTAFDAGTLAELFIKQSDYLLKDFSILQLENIKRIVKAKEIARISGNGIWLKFNGGSSTPEAERRENATELTQLVQNTYWCTKTAASGQIDGGDFYVYVTESEDKWFPRIAIRMDENKVGEVRGNASAAQDLEPEMIPIAESFLEKNFQDESGKKWLESVRYNKRAYNLYLKVLEEGVFEGFVEEFIDLKKDEKRFTLDYSNRNGHIQQSENYLNDNKDELMAVYGDMVAFDINEFNPKTTEIIIGDGNFMDSQVQDLGNLQLIGGGAYFWNSQVQNLGNLQTIGGRADFRGSQVQDLGNLQTIGGIANFSGSQFQSLGKLQTIGGDAYFENSQVQDLGNVQTIWGDAFLRGQVQSLGNLQTIGGKAYFGGSQFQSLGNLQTIGGGAGFGDSQVQELGKLQTIGGEAIFRNSKIPSLGNLQKIGKDANFTLSQVQSLGNLQTIGGFADFRGSQVPDLGNLQTIRGDANFSYSQVQDLGNLQTIGGDANFKDSKVKNLGNLQTIGGNAYFENSQIESLGNLQTIGRWADFRKRTDLEAEWEAKQKAVEMGRGGNVSPSKTPAPIKERIYGSKMNKPESSASLRSASSIKLSPENISTLNKKVLEFKSKYINRSKKMTLDAVKAVMRRGMGAYSSTHRPTISGGKPNSRVAWGLARVNAFLYKAEKGIPKNPNYVQDDDLLRELGYKLKMSNGGSIYEPQLNEFDELELKKGGEISSDKFVMPSKEILEYGQFLKEKHPEVWKAGGNIFGNKAFENLKKVSKRGYWLESERWMYDKWQSFVKRHQHNHQLAGVVANVKWASWGNIGKAEAKSVIENAFSKN